MMDNTAQVLRQLNVDEKRIHFERFACELIDDIAENALDELCRINLTTNERFMIVIKFYWNIVNHILC